MNSRHEWWVGLMFFVALITMLMVTVKLSDFSLSSSSNTIDVVFDSVKGLREGDDVNVAGMRIGKVGKVEFDPSDGRVHVTLWLRESVRLTEGYSIAINDTSLLGGTNVDIVPGAPDAPEISTDGELKGEKPVAMLSSIGTVVDDLSENVGTILENVKQITNDLRAGKGSLGKMLTDTTLFDSFSETSENLRKITGELEAGEGTIGKLLAQGEVYEDLSATMADLSALAKDLREGDSTLALLLRERNLYDELSSSLDGLKSITAGIESGEGTLGKLLNDSTLHDSLLATIEDLRTVAGDLEDGKGTLGLLLRDDEARAEFDTVIDDLRSITTLVRGGDGTVAKLLESDELYTELMKTFQTVTGAIEDARESAPLNTFSAALFSAF